MRKWLVFICCVFFSLNASSITNKSASGEIYAQNLTGEDENESLEDLRNRLKREREARRQADNDAFENACQEGSLEALENYMETFPKGRHLKEAQERIADYKLWDVAKRKNTIKSYLDYLKQSQTHSYEKEAKSAISYLASLEKWAEIKDSKNPEDFARFISDFPSSTYVIAAERNMHMLRASEYYNKRDLQNAYDEFMVAGGRNALDNDYLTAFDECEEYVDYKSLDKNATENQLVRFLWKHPHTKHKNIVNNRIALTKAANFTIRVTETELENALSYATTEETKLQVKNAYNAKLEERRQNIKRIEEYQAQQEREKKEREKEEARRLRSYKNRNFGSPVTGAIELFDLGFDLSQLSSNEQEFRNIKYFERVAHLQFGLSVRFGRYTSPVQFEVGINPGILFYKETDFSLIEYIYGEEVYKETYDKNDLTVPVYGRFKVHISNDDEHFYLDVAAYYNAMRNKDIQKQFSLGGGLGCDWRHWDWRIIHYRVDVDSDFYNFDNHSLGTSLRYCF